MPLKRQEKERRQSAPPTYSCNKILQNNNRHVFNDPVQLKNQQDEEEDSQQNDEELVKSALSLIDQQRKRVSRHSSGILTGGEQP
jgi:hypothetical protein